MAGCSCHIVRIYHLTHFPTETSGPENLLKSRTGLPLPFLPNVFTVILFRNWLLYFNRSLKLRVPVSNSVPIDGNVSFHQCNIRSLCEILF